MSVSQRPGRSHSCDRAELGRPWPLSEFMRASQAAVLEGWKAAEELSFAMNAVSVAGVVVGLAWRRMAGEGGGSARGNTTSLGDMNQ